MHFNEVRRKAVLGPGESDPLGSLSEMINLRKGSSARDPVNQTSFRQMERIFKKSSIPTEIPSVISGSLSDFELSSIFNAKISILPFSEYSRFISPDSFLYHSQYDQGLRIITFTSIPGLIYVPKMIHKNAQLPLLLSILKDAMTPASSSNLDILFENGKDFITPSDPHNHIFNIPKEGLFRKIQKDSWKNSDATIALFRRYRWVALGVQYEWTSKEYRWDAPHSLIPEKIKTLSIDICGALLGSSGCTYRPEAGIINYYQPGDTLMGHVDRSEKDESSPLLSISLGLDCVFLVGGSTRDDPVLPFCLSSGDVLILMNESRRNYHGVPLIIPGTLPQHFLVNDMNAEDDSEESIALKLINNARINVNIRQVWPTPSQTC